MMKRSILMMIFGALAIGFVQGQTQAETQPAAGPALPYLDQSEQNPNAPALYFKLRTRYSGRRQCLTSWGTGLSVAPCEDNNHAQVWMLQGAARTVPGSPLFGNWFYITPVSALNQMAKHAYQSTPFFDVGFRNYYNEHKFVVDYAPGTTTFYKIQSALDGWVLTAAPTPYFSAPAGTLAQEWYFAPATL